MLQQHVAWKETCFTLVQALGLEANDPGFGKEGVKVPALKSSAIRALFVLANEE